MVSDGEGGVVGEEGERGGGLTPEMLPGPRPGFK